MIASVFTRSTLRGYQVIRSFHGQHSAVMPLCSRSFRTGLVPKLQLRVCGRHLSTRGSQTTQSLTETEDFYAQSILTLHKTLRLTRRLGGISILLLSFQIYMLSSRIRWLEESIHEWNEGFGSAGRTLVEGYKDLHDLNYPRKDN